MTGYDLAGEVGLATGDEDLGGDPVNVLYICADRGIPLDGHKGAAVHVRQTLRGLVRQGCKVRVLAARPGRGVDLPVEVAPTPSSSFISRPRGAPLLREMQGIETACELAATAPYRRGEIDVIYERYSLWSVAGAALADSLKVPLVLETNAPLPDEQRRYRKLELEPAARGIERYLMRRANAVLCVSSALERRVRDLRGSGRDVHLFPNAVDTAAFRPAGDRRSVTGAPMIGFVGTLKTWHGLSTLLEAFAGLVERFSGARLLLVGDGPERERLTQQAQSLGVTAAVEWLGAVPHERVPEILSRATIAVAPYPDLEDFYFSPLKVAEYLAAGLPVVASACGDLRSLLRHRQTALLVRPGDSAALGAALIELSSDENLRRRLGRAGRELAEQQLSLDLAERRLRTLLDRLTGVEKRPRFSEVS